MSDQIVAFTSPLRIDSESQLLGRGGFGTVYRIHNKLDGQVYAVKRILVTEESLKCTLHEIRILASMTHPRIIRYYHAWMESRSKSHPITDETDQDRLEDESLFLHQDCYYFFYLQMQCCKMSLRDFLEQYPIRDAHVDTVLDQVLEGLDYLHGQGVVHRDIKPDNLLLTSLHPFTITISDFGLAKVFRHNMLMTERSGYVGTYLYASPEQAAGESCFFPTDVYSLGIVMYEMQLGAQTTMERVLRIQCFRTKRQVENGIRHGPLLLFMTENEACRRPTVSFLRYERQNKDVALWCRDILWEIIWKSI